MRVTGRVVVAAAVGMIVSGAGHAADLQAPVAPVLAQTQVGGWQVAISPYVWAAGISGDVAQFGSPTVHVSPSFGDVLKNLDFAAMVIGEARNGNVSLFADLMYTKLSVGTGTPYGILAGSVNVTPKTMAGLFGAGYAIMQDSRGHLDLAVGVRAWRVSTTLSFDGGLLGGTTFKDNATWIDGMAGFRGRYNFTDKLYFTGWGLAGAGGAKLDWDVAGGIGYQFRDNISAIIGYRALGVNYQDNGFVFDVIQHGPIIGLVAHF